MKVIIYILSPGQREIMVKEVKVPKRSQGQTEVTAKVVKFPKRLRSRR